MTMGRVHFLLYFLLRTLPHTLILRCSEDFYMNSSHSLLEKQDTDSCEAPAVGAIITSKRGVEVPPRPSLVPPRPCGGGAGADGRSCVSLDVRLAVLLVTLAGVAVLLLLYRLLQLRHRLRMARASHALEYYGFYHSATYRLSHTPLFNDEAKTVPNDAPLCDAPVLTVTPPTITITSLPPLPRPPPPTPPPVAPATPLLFPPSAQATPPSPHLSWGACSDAEVYARIGAFRTSRLSSQSSHSRVILFEHSSL